MNVFKVIFQLFVLYLLYKLIFDFIIPVYKNTKDLKKQMNDMQGRMNEQMENFQQNAGQPQQGKTGQQKPPASDYIEYEEVK
jgi:hypothetical protein